MKLAIGSDERAHLTDAVIRELEAQGHELKKFGALRDDASQDEKRWPNVARDVAECVASGECEQGILFCWTGTGVTIAANKVPNVRAALCFDAETAKGARRWNDANILAMSLRLTSETVAKEILREWFSAKPDSDDENQACLAALTQNERKHLDASQNETNGIAS
ncbi:MAG: RpiB/LacA/LacB family sugar-phosphate isomerase [Chloroherpetonaceae bacterium]|nr:RpiB/LacA/LacB family sugar-phosphate isomerase [Chloroherpetonaceae bacterium]MDW8436634.1 RpiB/LacA/LacB family sugar-phosphate isomerase [Chloroherpetonaceae bacterium]